MSDIRKYIDLVGQKTQEGVFDTFKKAPQLQVGDTVVLKKKNYPYVGKVVKTDNKVTVRWSADRSAQHDPKELKVLSLTSKFSTGDHVVQKDSGMVGIIHALLKNNTYEVLSNSGTYHKAEEDDLKKL
jgi:hypothetical protein